MTEQVLGYELDDSAEKPVETGFQRITYYNQDLNYHDGTAIARGGFGVDVANGVAVPPFGEVQKINHIGADRKQTTAEAMVASSVEVAIIGASDAYTSYWPDSDKSKQPILAPQYFTAGDKNATRSGISLFIVFRCDPEQKVWELPVKTFNVKNAQALLSQIDAGTRALKRYFVDEMKTRITGEFRRYALWVTLAAGETIKVGGDVQGNCTKVKIAWPKSPMAGADYFAMRVDPATYQKFKALREELDTMIGNGFRRPVEINDLPQLEAAYRSRASTNTERDGDSQPRLTGGAKPFDVTKIPGGSYKIEALMKLKGAEFLVDLDEMISVATRDGNYRIENALADLNIDSYLSIPPDTRLDDFMRNVLAAYATKHAAKR